MYTRLIDNFLELSWSIRVFISRVQTMIIDLMYWSYIVRGISYQTRY